MASKDAPVWETKTLDMIAKCTAIVAGNGTKITIMPDGPVLYFPAGMMAARCVGVVNMQMGGDIPAGELPKSPMPTVATNSPVFGAAGVTGVVQGGCTITLGC